MNSPDSGQPAGQDLDKLAVQMFGRHFISLACKHFRTTTRDDHQKFVISGFLLSINDLWYLATAGHVIDAISKLVADSPERTFTFGIIDNFGTNAKFDTVIPFDYQKSLKWTTDEERTGADFGLIMIEPFYRRQIEVNEPLPINEAQWRSVGEEPFDSHIMVGIPNETLGSEVIDYYNYAMVSLPLTEINEEQLPPTIASKSYPTFYAELGPTPDLGSIQGMSGCPIFGLGKDRDGNWRYWLVAVQSGWYRDRMPRIIYASRFKELATAAEVFFEDLMNRLSIEGA